MSTASPFLTVDGLRLARGATEVLKGVTLSVSKGELVALMGLSGGGKTTVLRTVVGLEGFEAGSVNVDRVALSPGPAPSGATLRALRTRVGMVFQYHGLFEHLTVLDNVTLAPLHVARLAREAAEARALTLLAGLGVDRHARAFPRELSGGEAQRVAIARALAMEPPLLLMDEPTASLDPARRNELGRALVALVKQGGRTLVVATHDEDLVRDFATRVVILADGAVVEEGPPGTVLSNPQHPATRFLLQTKEREPAPDRPPRPHAPRVPRGRAPAP
ncbi:MAG TPA: ATP-binding cassette domain-containing protein [Thermoanaerobaculia bacterium]|nr:ATP-binding cassette domain-containing protein [Thermoanaerobaculia bacterium]